MDILSGGSVAGKYRVWTGPKVEGEDRTAQTGHGSNVSEQGSTDTVSLSSTARELSKILAKSKGKLDESDTDQQSDPVARLKKKIKELEEKIEKVVRSELPEEAKQSVIAGMRAELASLNQQLAQLAAGNASGKNSGASVQTGGKILAKS